MLHESLAVPLAEMAPAVGAAGRAPESAVRSRVKLVSPGKSTASRSWARLSMMFWKTTASFGPGFARIFHPVSPAAMVVGHEPVRTTTSSSFASAARPAPVNSNANSGCTRPTGSKKKSTLRVTSAAACARSSAWRAAGRVRKVAKVSEAAVFGSASKQRGSTSTEIVAAPPLVKDPRTGMSGIGWAGTDGAERKSRAQSSRRIIMAGDDGINFGLAAMPGTSQRLRHLAALPPPGQPKIATS